jgi:hypothetical protein
MVCELRKAAVREGEGLLQITLLPKQSSLTKYQIRV